MKIVVTHPSLNRGGGAERVCLTTIKALVQKGHEVRLATIDKTDWKFLERRYGRLWRPSKESHIVETMPVKGTISQAIFTVSCFLPELVLLSNEAESDLVINTYGDLADSIVDVSYINAIPARLAHQYPQTFAFTSFPLLLMGQSYGLFLRALEKLGRRRTLIANSKFLQDVIRRHLRRDSLVVYPPVDTQMFKQKASKANLENAVLTVTRVRSGKRLELVPCIARLTRKATFTIVGLVDQASQGALSVLKKAIDSQGVHDRVRLVTNRPFQELLAAYTSAKLYLHTQQTESFGISIVEAMAAGCVPIVPRDGGPWFDILDQKQGEYGYSYDTVGEAARYVRSLLGDEQLRVEISRRAQIRAMDFDSAVFERKIQNFVRAIQASAVKSN